MVVKDAGDGFEPLRPFEPPVAEELGVERAAEDGRDGVVEGGVEGLADEADEVSGVGLDTLGGEVGVVGLLAVSFRPWSR